MNFLRILVKIENIYLFYLEHFIIAAEPDYGFNLIVIDPPWENASAKQKSRCVSILLKSVR